MTLLLYLLKEKGRQDYTKERSGSLLLRIFATNLHHVRKAFCFESVVANVIGSLEEKQPLLSVWTRNNIRKVASKLAVRAAS